MTNRLLLEARGATHAEIWENVGGRELLSNNDQLIPVQEQGGAIPGLTYRSMHGAYARQEAPAIMQGQASVSHVTGSHAFKAGFDLLQGHAHESVDGQRLRAPARFNNGVPNLITRTPSPMS